MEDSHFLGKGQLGVAVEALVESDQYRHQVSGVPGYKVPFNEGPCRGVFHDVGEVGQDDLLLVDELAPGFVGWGYRGGRCSKGQGRD